MPWFKIDDGLCIHPKWVGASPRAKALWTTAGSWCAGKSHDGVVPTHMLRMLGGSPRDASELVDAGLWETHPEGWLFHDWADQNPTTDEVKAKREKEREKKRRQREAAMSSRDENGRYTG